MTQKILSKSTELILNHKVLAKPQSVYYWIGNLSIISQNVEEFYSLTCLTLDKSKLDSLKNRSRSTSSPAIARPHVSKTSPSKLQKKHEIIVVQSLYLKS